MIARAGNSAFTRLIEPIRLDEFFDSYDDKTFLLIDGRGKESFEEFISVAEISDFLTRTDIRYPSIRLAKDGAELALESYARELKIGPHVSHDLIDNEKMFCCYNDGATIIVQLLQNNLPRFGRFVDQLEEAFACNVHASAFITPQNAQGFTTHYDTYSFFALQIHGRKTWKLYPRTELKPIREDRLTERPWVPCDPIAELTLEAGDLLYVPRGLFHAASTESEASIHITIGLFLPTWLDIIRSAITEIEREEKIRETPDLKSGELDASALLSVKEFLLSRLDLQAGANQLLERQFARRTDLRDGRLLDLLALSEVDLNTKVEIFPNVSFRIVSDDNSVLLLFADKNIRLAARVEDTLKVFAAGVCASIGEVQDRLDSQFRLKIVKLLIKEGFLRRAR
ncbi:JmjC domain-containing protein [Bradyrhizobium sp. SZCCHNR2032]|uniref:JmjC domain-containing protein n=1 Tax=Bradyrhizobium sp. SZCCHNR2032 TaxID=3057384 RepID=UPI002916F53E|nr:cupin domain-containing protein [Bradyrhizobium sp. SZCCHNR2032]